MKFLNLIFSVLLLFACSCNNTLHDQQDGIAAKETAIKTNLNDMVNDCWNKKDMAKFRTISSENFSRNVNDISVSGNRNETEAAMNIFFTGFPDLRLTIESAVIADSVAFIHWSATGSNTGIFGETPATGKKVKFSGYTVGHYDMEGKFSGEDVYYNELSLMQQLGYTLLPPVLK